MHLLKAMLLVSVTMLSAQIVKAETTRPARTKDHVGAAIRRLHWIKGPTTVKLFNLASINVPAGYVFLNPQDNEKFQVIARNIPEPNQYLLAPQDLSWFSNFSYDQTGYVRDDETIDSGAILSSITRGTEDSNPQRREQGFPEMHILGWKQAPHYDLETKRLEWAIDGRNSNNDDVVNLNVRILGREGVTSAVLVADPQQLATAASQFKSALTSYRYDDGRGYAEYKPGDKIAEYGLGALIAGGAAAVATKTGLWKTILVAAAAGWKFVLAGIAALFAGVAKLFKRKGA